MASVPSTELFARSLRNLSPARLYELGVQEEGAQITATGALATNSGEKTGRSPKDKRVVRRPESEANVDWGDVNVPLEAQSFEAVLDRAKSHLADVPRLYVVDGYAGWDPRYRIKVRIYCALAYHALFMRNMLIRPSPDELRHFGSPDLTIYNAGALEADTDVEGVDTPTCIAISIETGQMAILGTLYAGEMKKGVFSLMNYLLPGRDILSMHCSANEGGRGDVTLLFGLSGTGKTTLSADPGRRLIGDDEHCWSDRGIFNIEGGCYAKCIDLSSEKEPDIYRAIRFGSVLENVVVDPASREVDYRDDSLTQNTRCSYPIEFIDRAKVPCTGGHPSNILFLTCDAFGVLPPVSRLSPAQAMYHFISGYTAKVAGTEVGVREPQATFSACFGAAFLMRHPTVYAEQLSKQLQRHGVHVWLVNTGWTGGGHGTGSRISLAYTRAIVDAIHSGALACAPTLWDTCFGFEVPTECPGVPADILIPERAWPDRETYRSQAAHLAQLFQTNFQRFADLASAEVREAGPHRPSVTGSR